MFSPPHGGAAVSSQVVHLRGFPFGWFKPQLCVVSRSDVNDTPFVMYGGQQQEVLEVLPGRVMRLQDTLLYCMYVFSVASSPPFSVKVMTCM